MGYGKELAYSVANLLKTIGPIAEMHRDYCGVGFIYHNGVFIYTHFYDGEPNLYPLDESGKSGVINRFVAEQDFVNWLSIQNDASLSGAETGDASYANNQRITQEKLKQFVRMFRV